MYNQPSTTSADIFCAEYADFCDWILAGDHWAAGLAFDE